MDDVPSPARTEDFGVDAVDQLAAPTRPDLTITGAHNVVTVAVKAALASKAEDSLGVLTGRMSGILPADPCDNSVDAWARHGLMSGVQASWTLNPRPLPPDLPNTLAHRLLYGGAHGLALMWVAQIKSDEGVTHGR